MRAQSVVVVARLCSGGTKVASYPPPFLPASTKKPRALFNNVVWDVCRSAFGVGWRTRWSFGTPEGTRLVFAGGLHGVSGLLMGRVAGAFSVFAG